MVYSVSYTGEYLNLNGGCHVNLFLHWEEGKRGSPMV